MRSVRTLFDPTKWVWTLTLEAIHLNKPISTLDIIFNEKKHLIFLNLKKILSKSQIKAVCCKDHKVKQKATPSGKSWTIFL